MIKSVKLSHQLSSNLIKLIKTKSVKFSDKNRKSESGFRKDTVKKSFIEKFAIVHRYMEPKPDPYFDTKKCEEKW